MSGDALTPEAIARLDARLAELRALTPDLSEGLFPVSDEAAVTARRIGRVMLALGRKPGMVVDPDSRGGCLVECDEVDVYIGADGRVASVVTLAEGDED